MLQELDPKRLGTALVRCQRPLWLGLSVGHPLGSVGSIGPFVKLAGDQTRIGFLSLAFAIAPKGAQLGDHIHQPGPRDTELLTGSTRVARLVRIAAARPNQESDTDCAVAMLDPEIETIGNVVPEGFPDAERRIQGVVLPEEIAPGDVVAFLGRSSGFSEGRVRVSELRDLDLQDESATYRFRLCFEVEGSNGPFCQPGDGGALVFCRNDARAIGLVLAGAGPEDGPEIGYVLPIQPALEAAKAELLLSI